MSEFFSLMIHELDFLLSKHGFSEHFLCLFLFLIGRFNLFEFQLILTFLLFVWVMMSFFSLRININHALIILRCEIVDHIVNFIKGLDSVYIWFIDIINESLFLSKQFFCSSLFIIVMVSLNILRLLNKTCVIQEVSILLLELGSFNRVWIKQ